MARVFVTRALPFEALDRLRAAHEVDEWPGDMPPSPDELRAGVAPAEGLLSLITDRVDTAVLDAAPRLRAIANMLGVAHQFQQHTDWHLRKPEGIE